MNRKDIASMKDLFVTQWQEKHFKIKLGSEQWPFAQETALKIYKFLKTCKTAEITNIAIYCKKNIRICQDLLLLMWKFDLYKQKEKIIDGINIRFITNNSSEEIDNMLLKIDCILFGRELCNGPSNDFYSTTILAKLKSEVTNCEITVLNKSQLEKEGMNLLLSVNSGSAKEPLVVIIKKGNSESAVCGKGVTFDSGGISLKPSDKMWDMVADMSGAAASIASAKYLASKNIDFCFLIGLVENMPDGNSVRPGDIVKSHNGKTVEILNTDAEGRLVLGDLVSYAEKLGFKSVLTIATLTGAAKVVFGSEYAALCTNNDNLKNKILLASKNSGEKVFPLPFDKVYEEYLKSARADIQNISDGKGAGVIVGGMFIKMLCNIHFAHIDIANVSEKGPNCSEKFNCFGAELLMDFFKTYK